MKKMNNISMEYSESSIYRIFEIYAKPDSKKYNKYVNALRKMEELDGWGFKILTYNKFRYSCAFLFINEEKEIMLYYFGMNDTEHQYKYYR